MDLIENKIDYLPTIVMTKGRQPEKVAHFNDGSAFKTCADTVNRVLGSLSHLP